jgi:hypothetical protein
MNGIGGFTMKTNFKEKASEIGQATTEYALMSMATLGACAFFFERMMSAYQYYTKAFYLLLVLPFP